MKEECLMFGGEERYGGRRILTFVDAILELI